MTDENQTINMAEHRVVELPTGRLSIEVLRSDIALDQLCGFAARRNPKRGFLFVSKVLGKHIPVRPSLMRQVHALLAAKIPADLPGPVVVIGMAETAVALGHGVYDEYWRQSGRRDLIFVHSSRYRLNRPMALEFKEEHSHAADHIVYYPENEDHRTLFERARSIVLVDDEASTGTTFVNLTRAFKEVIPSLQKVVTVAITDWRGQVRSAANRELMPVDSRMVSILEGEYQFEPAPNLMAVEMPKVIGNNAHKDVLLPRNHGRLGMRGPAQQEFSVESLQDTCRNLCPVNGMRIPAITEATLVLGTGEFAYPPFLLAEALEAAGHDVHYQSTTRSPVMIDTSGAIAAGLNFADNYDDGIPNFVYNVSPGQYERVIIAHETPSGSLDKSLIEALNAHSVEL